MEKILIIEDDKDINNLINELLTKEGYCCTQAFTGTEGLMKAASEGHSLIILDLMLPNLSGEMILSEIRENLSTPVIVISAKSSIDSKVELLNIGANDYITKPFDIAEFLARVKVQLRTSAYDKHSDGKTDITFKDITLDSKSFSVLCKNKPLSLTKHEFKILELLIKNPDRIFSKQDIYDYAWDDIYIGEDKTVNVHISNLRKKIKEFSDEEYIETVWGIVFKLVNG